MGAFELFESNRTDTTDTYVVHIKTGAVQGPFRSAWQYAAHHMNAYESAESEIIMDITPTPFENMRNYVSLQNMMNPPEDGSPELMLSTTGGKEIVRYTLDLAETNIVESNFPNSINSRYINTFDFPMINEAYRRQGLLRGEQLHVRDALLARPLRQGRRRRGVDHDRVRRGARAILPAPHQRDHLCPDEQGLPAPPYSLVCTRNALS